MGGIHYQPKSYKDYKYLYTFYSRSFRTVSLLFKNRPSKCLKFYLKNFYSSNSLSRLGLPLVVENGKLLLFLLCISIKLCCKVNNFMYKRIFTIL
jgi:hypothetical protein